MKLYRIVPYDPEVDRSKHGFVSTREMLVEVVPDYEAAHEAFLKQTGDDWYESIIVAVDAALTVGDN